MSDPPSSKPKVSDFNYQQDKKYQNADALDLEDPSNNPSGVECFVVKDVNLVGVQGKKITVDKLVILIPAVSEATAVLASGNGAILSDGGAFTLTLAKQDGLRVDKHAEFCQEVADFTEASGHEQEQSNSVRVSSQLIIQFS
jgi:hypothetical protein